MASSEATSQQGGNQEAGSRDDARPAIRAGAGTGRRVLVPALWTALALLLGLEAYLALIACGVSVFGFQTRNCPAPAPERAAPAADSDGHFDDLLRRIGEAEGRLAARPACRADNPAPLEIPPELRQPPAAVPAPPDAAAPPR